MTLLLLLLVLTLPYFGLTLAGQFFLGLTSTPAIRARISLAIFFAFTAVGHFIRTAGMVQMLPPFLPFRYEIIYFTGALEVLGAAGLLMPRYAKAVGVGLIIMLAALLPANIYSACNYVNFGGHGAGPIYLIIRIPFQFLLMWCVYLATGLSWFAVEVKGISLAGGRFG